MKMLTEREVAELLRCSQSKIRRLRRAGELAYIPGRPVLIDEMDLAAYLGRQKRQERLPVSPPSETNTIADDARAWALAQVIKPKKRRK
ncbi:hypothetical protein BJF93_15390 [Xaviernesmea oryzae]|uniref:Helix-turn-helix domain-containing protein n=1 Tax=Xaviernesmea oryzae TaxID=464029 RepID=A0A1Q9AY36_9HYPH|nr:helix-turn-helix domain-containing protein [Xaviernesmea oryzae]OLP60339.1 hypothetical protein BJF93_15390 [Xaviernesmea oryzae]SEK22727.1 DNA binding domain-containing protein, excisionase family [Xaviernesmea oryzae]